MEQLTWVADQLLMSSGWELIALVLALAYLMLAAHQRQWCWLAAAVSCTIYALIFWQAKLYMESLLQVIYIALAGYGWWQWQHKDDAAQSTGFKFSWRWHLRQWLWLTPLAIAIALALQQFTDADAVWLDTFTTCFSLLSTWLIAQKAFETWWYWLIIDTAYVYLYWSKGFVATALLFVLYVVLVIYAMYRWRRDQHTELVTES